MRAPGRPWHVGGVGGVAGAAWAAGAGVLLAFGQGCNLVPSGLVAPRAVVRSDAFAVEMSPRIPSRHFHARSHNEVEFYLSDLRSDRVAPGRGLGGLSGEILRLEMFIRPRPGQTPIEPTATTATVTYIVLVEGEVGVYVGAGFFIPSGLIEGSRFGGELREATLRLEASTPGFEDRLGPSTMTASFVASENELVVSDFRRATNDFINRARSFVPGVE